ncbi:MAG: UpxY family transcription antiterminator, partial [Paramuribaculum sp.]|nr:UpxY family transcription antiterminator [Paramuribaculum sp.]
MCIRARLRVAGFRVFTPMKSKIATAGGKRIRIEVPFIHDLIFVLSEKDKLDRVVAQIETLQYRYVKGAPYCTPMTVPTHDMDRFMAVVSNVKTPKYYSPEEITSNMCGVKVKMICEGPLNGIEGRLLKIKGSGKKRFLVELPGVLAASIEIGRFDFIEFLEK